MLDSFKEKANDGLEKARERRDKAQSLGSVAVGVITLVIVIVVGLLIIGEVDLALNFSDYNGTIQSIYGDTLDFTSTLMTLLLVAALVAIAGLMIGVIRQFGGNNGGNTGRRLR